MCASYGLEPAEHGYGIPPLDEPHNAARILEWIERGRGVAKITGRRAENLNPLIVAADGARRLELAWWWLHIGGEPARFSAFNSRDDRLMSRWRRPFQTRGLLPASWYVEKGRRFGIPGMQVFAMAAITTRARREDGSELVTYSLVTRDAVAEARSVHPRMPLILPEDMHDTWLDPQRPGDEDLVFAAVDASEALSEAARIIDTRSGAPAPAPEPTLF